MQLIVTKQYMSKKKKQVREQFRQEVFKRDRYRCRICGRKLHFGSVGLMQQEEYGIKTILDILDSHHIMSRDDMPNGGYVKENGICLCKIATLSPNNVDNVDDGRTCHEKAEEWLKTGQGVEGYDPDTLYRLIGSSLDLAMNAAEKLNVR